MRAKNSLIVSALVGSLSAAAEGTMQRPMSEMNGGCANFAMPLSKEMSIWDKNQIRVQSAQDNRSTTTLPAEKRVSLSLHPQKKVALAAKPEKDFSKGAPSFAGLATIDVKADGLYRVAMGSKVWLDVVEAESALPVAAEKFEMQTGCDKIFKAVEYNLKAGKKYFLQISSSTAPEVQVITRLVK